MHPRRVVERLGIHEDSRIFAALRRPYSAYRLRRGDVSHSQYGEDLIVRCLLPRAIGRYIDVGSGHPIAGSNTFSLYQLGWQGWLIDPVRANIEASRRIRKRDTVLMALCGSASGSQTFYEYDPYQLSTTALDRVRQLETQGHLPTSAYSMPTITLGELGVRVSPREPFFLNVDVEGADMEVLRGIDWEVFLPGVICIEEHESPLQGPTVVSGYLEERGYTLQAYSIASSIYAHADSVNPPANHGGMGNVNG